MNIYKVNKDTAKNLFIRLLYFGTFKVWADDNKITTEPTKFILNFSKELNKIGELIYKKNKHLLNILNENDDDELLESAKMATKSEGLENEYKKKARVVSYCLQEIECKCLE